MWKKLDKEAEKLGRSEIKEKKLKIETFTRTTKMNVKPENKQQENKQQQTKKNNNENITTTTTMKNLKMKTLEPKQDDKPNMNKIAKPNSRITVKGKHISDLGSLRDFLTKKSLERAERGAKNIDASHSLRTILAKSRDQPNSTGESEKPPNQIQEGLESAAKGEYSLRSDDYNWTEQAVSDVPGPIEDSSLKN